MNEMKCLTDHEIKEWCKDGKLPNNVVVVDIREPGEYRREHISGSKNIPRAELGKSDLSAEQDKIAIFHCASGNRTRQCQEAILACGFKETYCLPEGIAQWKRCQLPVIYDRSAPIEIMRQVQITAGSLVVIGILLSTFIHPYFILLSAFIGAGLIFSGVSGTCGMGKMLSYMPWNRVN